MRRFHVHINVEDLQRSIGFYRMLFDVEPTVVKADYAKWMLDDPRINFAISQRGTTIGVDHLGVQVESEAELDALGARLHAADAVTLAEQGTVCCYARSDKFWAEDPQGVRWESFHSLGTSATYTQTPDTTATTTTCCGPAKSSSTGDACC